MDLDKIDISREDGGKKFSLIISESSTKAFTFKEIYQEVKELSKNTSNTLVTLTQLHGFVKKFQDLKVHASVQGVFDFKSPEKKLNKLEGNIQKKISFIENLFEAARTGDVEGIKNLSSDKADFNIRVNGATPLGLAVKNGHLEAAKTLIDGGAYVNFQNSAGLPPHFYVTDVGFLNLFIEKKANLNFQDKQGQTLLIYAARAGHREIVETLIKHNVKISLRDNSGKTALGHAWINNHMDIVEMLLPHAGERDQALIFELRSEEKYLTKETI